VIGAWRKSRGWGKFRRNRLALAATAGILAYLLCACAAWTGILSLEDTTMRVGPDNLPGFGLAQDPEERYENADFLLGLVARPLDRPGGEVLLKEVRVGLRRVAKVPLDELRARVAKVRALQDALDDCADLDRAPEREPQLRELEAAVDGLFQPLGGWASFRQSLLRSLGTDRQGRSIAARAVYAVKIAFQVGFVVALFSVLFGGLLGAAAAFFGGIVDIAVIWLYSSLSSVPNLVLLGVLVFMFAGTESEQTLLPLYVAFCLTFWIGPCRVVRGEVLRLRESDYVQAARSLGLGRMRILLRHVMPNVGHLMFVQFSLLFIGAIKSEVILTFLGLGVKNQPSWGAMIDASRPEILNEFFWQIGAATALMFGLVLALNVVTDALQDALDPRYIA